MTRREQRKPGLEKEREQLHTRAKRELSNFFLERDPIKQYVRKYGWLSVIQEYVLRRTSDGVDRPITYLTFPGPVATDVGLLWQKGILKRTDSGFPDLIICDEKNADKALRILGEVKAVSKIPFIRAIDELAPYFPIDVVNLDIYGNVVTGSQERRMALRTLDAIEKIFNLQRGQCFLLLLTCSTDDRSAQGYLEDCFQGNLSEEQFREAFYAKYNVLDTSPFNNDYRAFVGLVLPKAIGRLARDRGYQTIEHYAGKYIRNGKRMLCHSFELIPLGRRKNEKKYETRFKNVEWDMLNEELSSKVRDLAGKAYVDFIPSLPDRDLIDIQYVLQQDSALKSRMKQEAESLIGWEKRNLN